MKDEEPHAVSDNEPNGEQSDTFVYIKQVKTRKIVVTVAFDDFTKEINLWNHIFDLKEKDGELIDFDSKPDYLKKIQCYEIISEKRVINRLRLWLMKNKFDYKLDK